MTSGAQGRFVVLEGLDGAGTTTQARLLTRALQARDLRVCPTAEPSDGPLGLAARAHVRRERNLDPYAAALVFTADRADHLIQVIRPALRRGEWVVCDRYLLSTLAYQGAGGVDRLSILSASRALDIPDLTVFLDVPDATRAQRMSARPRVDRYEAPELSEGLRASYEASIELLRARGDEIEIFDGSAEPHAVLELILARLDALP